jgi:hypothetical protein
MAWAGIVLSSVIWRIFLSHFLCLQCDGRMVASNALPAESLAQ